MVSPEVSELRRFNALGSEWSLISDFIAYLEGSNVILAERYGPDRLIKANAPLKAMLADYFEIDLIRVEKEKNELVDHYLKEVLASE